MAETPTWRDPLRNPLILYPAGMAPDFGFISGALVGAGDPSGWHTNLTAAAVVATGVGEQIGVAVRFNPTAQTCGVDTYYRYTQYLSQPSSSTTQMTWVARVKCVSQSGNPVFSARVDYYDSSAVFLASDDTVALFTCGTTLPADSTWRVIRGQFTPTVNASNVKVGLAIGFLSAATADVYVDWIAVGLECNLGDFGPHQLGAYISGEAGVTKHYDRTQTIADDGTIETCLYNTGLKSVSFKTTAFDETALAKYRNFHDYCSDRTPFMLIENIQDVSRGLHESLALDQSDDGIDRIKGTPLYTASIKAKEVFFDGRA